MLKIKDSSGDVMAILKDGDTQPELTEEGKKKLEKKETDEDEEEGELDVVI